MPGAARGQHQDGDGHTGIAPSLEERQPVDLREPQVEHHRVIALGLREEVRLFLVRGAVHHVAGRAQCPYELIAQR